MGVYGGRKVVMGNGQNREWCSEKVIVFLKVLLAVYALSENSLKVLEEAYALTVPGIKQIFFVVMSLNGWGIKNLVIAIGLFMIFWRVRKEQKCPKITILSSFFAFCTVLGISYQKTDSWDCLFFSGRQFLLAVFIMAGFYVIYKNCFLLGLSVLEGHSEWFYREPKKMMEIWIFSKYPFLGPFLVFLLCGLPWIICFFPGTMQWDGHAQLWMALGVDELSGHHPVVSTWLMGSCIMLGRNLFQSDTIGLAFYTLPQFLIQCLVFAYGSRTMRKWNCPVILSKGALFLWGIFPLFPTWGITLVKDTAYYIFVTLFFVAFMDFNRKESDQKAAAAILMLLGILGGTLVRKEGKYLFILSLGFALFTLIRNPEMKYIWKKYAMVYLAGITLCVGTAFVIEGIYMPHQQILPGEKVEALSIPLQQTARYLKEYDDEVTPEEKRILELVFEEDLAVVAEAYNPVLSDPVKELIENEEYLPDYFTVWREQFKKHPDTYLQAFLNHIYGYFYPDALYIGGRIWDCSEGTESWGEKPWYFKMGNTEHWEDGHLDLRFIISNEQPRRILEQFAWIVQRMPILGMIFSPGLYVYIVIAMAWSKMGRKEWREIQTLIPAAVIILISMLSPVNAYLRYIIPVISMMPVLLAWESMRYAGDKGKHDI